MYPIWVLMRSGWPAMSNPATSPLPEVGAKRPHNMRMVVLFPAPLGPRNPKIWPWGTEKLTWSTAVKSPNRRVRPSTATAHSPLRRGRFRMGSEASEPSFFSGPATRLMNTSSSRGGRRLDGRGGHAGFFQGVSGHSPGIVPVLGDDVDVFAEQINACGGLERLFKHLGGFSGIACGHGQDFLGHALPDGGGRALHQQPSLVHEPHPAAPLRLVQIGGGHQNGHAFLEQTV